MIYNTAAIEACKVWFLQNIYKEVHWAPAESLEAELKATYPQTRLFDAQGAKNWYMGLLLEAIEAR